VVVFFALLLPTLLALGSVVVGVGNWFVHARHLQTKADAGALAGGAAWSFPCAASGDTDTAIINEARQYAGPTNPQVGHVPDSDIHSVLNGTEYYDDDTQTAPAEFTSPSGSVCEAKILDVKVTEDNAFPLASLLPLFPDIKRKARVEIQEGSGESGLLPLSVRVPKPASAAAIYIDERTATFGQILATQYLNDICEPATNYSDCLTSPNNMPSGLDQWTSAGNQARITNVPEQVGVVIALSFRPPCVNPGQPARCFDISPASFPGGSPSGGVNALCNQGTGSGIAKCYYTTEDSNANQTVRSGLQFIRSYANPSPGDQAPDLLGVWIDTPTGVNCTQGYFSAPVNNPCTVLLHANVNIDAGTSYEIRYKLVSGNTSAQDDTAGGPGCNHNNFGGGGSSCLLSGGQASVVLDPAYAQHAFAIQVRLGGVSNPTALGWPAQCAGPPSTACSWFWTGLGRSQTNPTGSNGADRIFEDPVQRAFMGDLVNKSGPVKFLHLYDVDCASDATVYAGWGQTGNAASVQAGSHCFKVDVGLQGALARDQNEYPIQINIGNTSQSAVVDCDPDIPNLKSEIEQGCGAPDGFPSYVRHDFAQVGPNGKYCPDWNGINNFFQLPKADPWDDWAPFTCIATQTCNNCNQVVQGFHQRIFGVQNNPSCPTDTAPFRAGRNYWHDANNQYDTYTFTNVATGHRNALRNDDPRFVKLFISPYNSFTGQGNQIYPITAIGGFYITGYGRILGNGNLVNEDPCATGAGTIGAGNTPPPDIDLSGGPAAIAWGHFVVPVNLGTSGGGTGELCQEGTATTCKVVLVE
jgi:hypothetical protein